MHDKVSVDGVYNNIKLEQLERLPSEDTPPMITRIIDQFILDP